MKKNFETRATIVSRLSATPQPATFPSSETRVIAGFPAPSQDYEQTRIDLNEVLIHDRAATYILRVYGDSMTEAGISDGDEIIVDRSIKPRDGCVIVAELDGEFTVKYFRIDSNGRGWLVPANQSYPAIAIEEHSDFSVFGVVTRSLHKLY